MFSVSPAEIATIAVIALLVFGPQRLPEIARRIGSIARELSRAAQDLKAGLEEELEGTRAPLDDIRRRLGTTVTEALEADPAEAATDETTGRSEPGGEGADR